MSNGRSVDPETGQENIGDEGGDAGDLFRTSHIKRIYQNDDPESEVWIDIERIDELWRNVTHASDTQLAHWIFNWAEVFDPDNTPKKTISDPNDDTNSIDVPIRNTYFVRSTQGGQASRFQFVNDKTNKARETHSRRIYNHEIKDAYLDEDGNPPSDPETYLKSLGEQDVGQYVDVEVIDANWSGHRNLRDIHGHKIHSFSGLLKALIEYSQRRKWLTVDADRLLRDPLLDNDEADPDFVPTYNPKDGPTVDPPWRLDPIQNIVNVQWGDSGAVIFGPHAEDAPKPSTKETGK